MPAIRFHERTLANTRRSPYRVYVPEGHAIKGHAPGRRWPVVLFLHGAGEAGEDGRAPTTVGLGPAIARHPERFPVLAVFPQCRRGDSWRGAMLDDALAALEETVTSLDGDRSRLYLTGVSMGGYGCWRLALQEPSRFAALVPVCGGLDSSERRRARPGPALERAYDDAAARLRHLPAWVFHGDADAIVPVEESRTMVAALERAGAPVRYTEYSRVGHASWTPAYADPELMPWLLSHAAPASA